VNPPAIFFSKRVDPPTVLGDSGVVGFQFHCKGEVFVYITDDDSVTPQLMERGMGGFIPYPPPLNRAY